MKIFILAAILVTIAFIALGVRIFFRRGGKFPETKVGHNRNMCELGITCAKCDERKRWNRMKRNRKPKIHPSELKIDINRLS